MLLDDMANSKCFTLHSKTTLTSIVVVQPGVIVNHGCLWLQLVAVTSLNARTGRAFICIRDVTV